jgi:hypothetical protein
MSEVYTPQDSSGRHLSRAFRPFVAFHLPAPSPCHQIVPEHLSQNVLKYLSQSVPKYPSQTASDHLSTNPCQTPGSSLLAQNHSNPQPQTPNPKPPTCDGGHERIRERWTASSHCIASPCRTRQHERPPLLSQPVAFGVRGLGFGVRGSGFGVRGSGFGVQGSGFGVEVLGTWSSRFGFWISGFGFRCLGVQGSGFGVSV